MYRGHNEVKIRSFFDQERTGKNAVGVTVPSLSAKKEAKKFINKPNINALDVQFVPGGVHIIYCTVGDEDVGED